MFRWPRREDRDNHGREEANQAPQEDTAREKTAEIIRQMSQNVELATADDVKKKLGDGQDLDAEAVLARLGADEKYSDITALKGKKTVYYYSTLHISQNYASMLARVSDQDLHALVAGTIRDESRIYPRPADARLFEKAPFHLSIPQVVQLVESMGHMEEYSDIQSMTASNGAVYFYSAQYLAEDHARGLMEWIEVEEEQIP